MAGSIVIWGGPPYFAPANSTAEEMARAFRALGSDVLYLELEGDGKHFRNESRMSPGPVSGTASSGEGVLVARVSKVPLAPYAMVGSILNVHMNMAVRQLRWLEPIWQDERPTIVLYGWFGSGLTTAFAGGRMIYDCVDESRAAESVEGHASRVEHVWSQEQQLIKTVPLTTCVSDELAADRRAIAPRLAVLPNASDPDWCKGTFNEPDLLAGVGTPRVLFTGRITAKIDLELIRQVASKDMTISWVLAGESTVPVGGMPANVRVLGRIHHDDIAPIAAHCHCGVVPLRSSDWNTKSSPLKLGDYAAAGLPIVSSPLPAAVAMAAELGDAVAIADGAEAFLTQIRAAIALGDEPRARLRAYAAAHTWQDRAKAMLAALDGTG